MHRIILLSEEPKMNQKQQIMLDITAMKKEGMRALEDAQTIVQLCEAVEAKHAECEELKKGNAELTARLDSLKPKAAAPAPSDESERAK